jgi:hypothetical protein
MGEGWEEELIQGWRLRSVGRMNTSLQKVCHAAFTIQLEKHATLLEAEVPSILHCAYKAMVRGSDKKIYIYVYSVAREALSGLKFVEGVL